MTKGQKLYIYYFEVVTRKPHKSQPEKAGGGKQNNNLEKKKKNSPEKNLPLNSRELASGLEKGDSKVKELLFEE